MDMQAEHARPEIGRVVVLKHPSYAAHADRAIDELKDANLGRDIVELPTQRTVDDAMELIDTKLEPHDAVIIEAGDGSRSTMIAAALRLASGNAGQSRTIANGISFTSGRAGNGRDGARADRGRWRMNAAPSWIVRNSVQTKAWGMAIKATERVSGSIEQRPLQATALLYAGVGLTAIGADIVASEEYKNCYGHIARVTRDVALALTILSDSETFSYVDAVGTMHTVSDITFAKGPTIGKLGWLPTEVWHKEIVQIDTGPKLSHRLGSMARVLTNTIQTPGELARVIVPTEDVQFYIDGEEPIWLAAGKKLSLSLTDATYNVLTTRHTGLKSKAEKTAYPYR
jgi:hypothetical protein